MRNIILFVAFYLVITQTAYEMEQCGGANHTVPKVLQYIFPLLFRRMRFVSGIDMVALIWWHIYMYSWIINVLINKSIWSYYDEFGTVLFVSMVIYMPFSIKEMTCYEKWRKAEKNFCKEYDYIDIVFKNDNREEYTIQNKKGARICISIVVGCYTLACIWYTITEMNFSAVGIWIIDIIFIFVWCNSVRWKIIVSGQKIIYYPMIGRKRVIMLEEIKRYRNGNEVVYVYGKEKRLFCIYTERQNAERLIKKLRENEELEVR